MDGVEPASEVHAETSLRGVIAVVLEVLAKALNSAYHVIHERVGRLAGGDSGGGFAGR